MFWTVVILMCLASTEVFGADEVYKNRHRPEFTHKKFSAVIPENTDVNSAVIQVEARDEDVGSSIVYSIESGNDDQVFEIDPENGIIKTKTKLDYEKKQSYNLRINANDGFYNAKCLVEIKVVNVNDKKPKFTKPYQEVEIAVNSLTQKCIVNATAYDPDFSANNESHKIVYSLLGDSEVQEFFKIDAQGCLTQKKAYDCNHGVSRSGEKLWKFSVQAKKVPTDKTNFKEIKVRVRCGSVSHNREDKVSN